MMTLTYAQGHDLIEQYVAARIDHSGDGLTALFTEEAEIHLEPFTAPLVGHNALRAYLLKVAKVETEYELTIERHWVSGDAVLAPWHSSWVPKGTHRRVRLAGFLVAELTGDGLIHRWRQWWNEAPDGADGRIHGR
jgi:hypothetical protein